MNAITVLAHVKAAPGNESQVRQELLALIAPSRKDPGCLNYDLHQAQSDPSRFLFHENWASQSLWETHLKTPHVRAALAKLGPLVADQPSITVWERISG